ncbi:homoprotocatechuate degradation operon regulator HpaR [Sagittula salina]|uniref:Homoprotocatechuate degradation operon regulator HpaR n=1 Tax=Sagittula salina TaxID=2820268 RepID=A0A940MM75_9RHOB|nr:homoprotocatechuate degradation operon regulator HpaR [Sagittula salina]MBP0481261.1 homoprotocatechuate degradation operon regulator HpaR [Sagittula salina]
MPDFPLSRPRRTLPIALLRAREAVMDRFRPMLREIDLTEAQWRVLRVLQEAPGIEPSHLAQEAVILAPSLTRVLKVLETRGVIILEKHPQDRRRTRVSLTEQGHALLTEAAQESARIYQRLETELGKERITTLLDLLEHMQDQLSRDDATP